MPCASWTVQIKWQVISSTEWIVWQSDIFPIMKLLSISHSEMSSWQFAYLSRGPFLGPFPWRLCALYPGQHAGRQALCPLRRSRRQRWLPPSQHGVAVCKSRNVSVFGVFPSRHRWVASPVKNEETNQHMESETTTTMSLDFISHFPTQSIYFHPRAFYSRRNF